MKNELTNVTKIDNIFNMAIDLAREDAMCDSTSGYSKMFYLTLTGGEEKVISDMKTVRDSNPYVDLCMVANKVIPNNYIFGLTGYL